MTAVLHPGWECCEKPDGLPAWAAERDARCRLGRRWAGVFRRLGERLDRQSLHADGPLDAERLRLRSIEAFGEANGYMDVVLTLEGQTERVLAAHGLRAGA